MGVGYTLVNIDKQELIWFRNINASKKREIVGIVAASSIVALYVLENSGDRIAFVNDSEYNFQLFGKDYSWDDFKTFKEVTDEYVQVLIDSQVYRDDGKIIYDQEGNYVRDLTNIWDPKFPWNK